MTYVALSIICNICLPACLPACLRQDTVRREYNVGRPIQWAGFSSTSRKESATKSFLSKSVGVLFKISVFSGTVVGDYSYLPAEDEVLLSPSTRFTVTKQLYIDDDGYACCELTEMRDHMFSS